MKNKLLLICTYLSFAINGLFAQNDSLEKLLATTSIDTIKLQVLTELSWNYAETDLNKAMQLAEEELALASKINNSKFIAQGYNDIGVVLIKQSKFSQSLKYHYQALKIRLKLTNQADIASSYSKIGYCYSEMDELKNALSAQLKALAIYRQLANNKYIAYTLNNICFLYMNLNNYDKVVQLANEAYAIGQNLHDDFIIGTALQNLSASFEKKGDFNSAILNEKKALTIFTNMGDSSNMAAIFNNLGFYYRQINNHHTALDYYLKASKVASLTKNLNSLGVYYRNIGNVYIVLGKYEQAKHYLNLAEKICKEQSLENTLLLVYQSFGNLYSLTNKGKLAVDYYQKFANLKDSMFTKDMAKQFSDMQVKYETKEKEAANLLLQKQNEVTSQQLAKSNAIKWLLVIGIVVLCVIFYSFYNSYKLRQKHVFNQQLLRQQEENSKAILDAEERERARIARDLHDGIGQQLSAAKLNIVALKNSITPTLTNQVKLFENATQLIDDAVNEVRSVSHNMMANSLIKSGLVSAVRDFIQKLNQSAGLKINIEMYGLDERLDSAVEIILFRVLQEIVNNIIKHAHATEINIQFVKHDNELSLLIEDNGVGFDTKKIDEFEGIGLKNIESRIKFLKGTVYFDSFVGKGTTVNIEVPLG